MNALLQKIQAPTKRLWAALAARQNIGFFVRSQEVQVPHYGSAQVCLPEGMDLRVSGQGLHNQPARLTLSTSGEAFLHLENATILLGALAQQSVETGEMITGLRLRGAVRFPKHGIVLMVPDREDLPYLLQVLAPRAPASSRNQRYHTALVA
ncbi:hypothetical protein [Armatimonas sp.]|uniref:hypothetical protein n=1 Tax=Armatimonas sp. TaxID=1872638 RepID=UPI00286A7AB3|nr:hypothetical protein [Armatimonas sp.]